MHRNAGIRNRCFSQLSHLSHKSPQMAGNTVTICGVQDLKLRKQSLRKPEGWRKSEQPQRDNDILYALWEKGHLPLISRAYLYKIHTKVAFGQKQLCNRFYHCSLWIPNIQCQPSLADSWFLGCLWPIQISILTPWDLHLKWPVIPLTTRLVGTYSTLLQCPGNPLTECYHYQIQAKVLQKLDVPQPAENTEPPRASHTMMCPLSYKFKNFIKLGLLTEKML